MEITVTTDDYVGIEELLHRYAMALDDRDARAFLDCWDLSVASPNALEKTIDYHRQYAKTMHIVLNHVHTCQDNTAAGTTYCIVSYFKNTGGKYTKFDTYSRYREALVKKDNRWLFLERQWEPIYSDEEKPAIKDSVASWLARQPKPWPGP
jgi:hypothetical protein